jgi:transcription elongation GreA/GreB family factor
MATALPSTPTGDELHEAARGAASALEDVVMAYGGAGPGSIVRVSDRAGRTSEYELLGRPDPDAARQRVPIASPVGRALLGARPGDYVHVTSPNGRRRRVRVTEVQSRPAAHEGRPARDHA